MTNIRQEINELLKLDFLKDKFKNTFEETCTQLRNNFSKSLTAIREDIGSSTCEESGYGNYYKCF